MYKHETSRTEMINTCVTTCVYYTYRLNAYIVNTTLQLHEYMSLITPNNSKNALVLHW